MLLSATEYIAGTTQNPLVVGLNDTTNSDKRIFGSDGNVTMRSGDALFKGWCCANRHTDLRIQLTSLYRHAQS